MLSRLNIPAEYSVWFTMWYSTISETLQSVLICSTIASEDHFKLMHNVYLFPLLSFQKHGDKERNYIFYHVGIPHFLCMYIPVRSGMSLLSLEMALGLILAKAKFVGANTVRPSPENVKKSKTIIIQFHHI